MLSSLLFILQILTAGEDKSRELPLQKPLQSTQLVPADHVCVASLRRGNEGGTVSPSQS